MENKSCLCSLAKTAFVFLFLTQFVNNPSYVVVKCATPTGFKILRGGATNMAVLMDLKTLKKVR
jgi:hypothetical protein